MNSQFFPQQPSNGNPAEDPVAQLEADQRFMRQALTEATRAYDAQEVPIGCLIVRNGRVIGRGWNQMESLKDPTAHAEILAIGAACQAVDNWRLDGCTLYVTLEPCPMCAGAILQSRIGRVVFGALDKRLGSLESHFQILSRNPINREILTKGPFMEEDCLGLIQEFFKELRSRSKENARQRASQSELEASLGAEFGLESEP